jgi:hypothetical protein
MMQEQVIVTPIKITKAGQVKHFQIKLPSNAKHIIGIEIGGKFLADTKAKVGLEIVPPTNPAADGTNGQPTKENGVTQNPVRDVIVGNENSRGLFKRNTLVGELKLQSCEEANIFYAGYLQVDNNMAYGDFTQNRFWKANNFTHQQQSFEDTVIVDADSTMIQGFYKDSLGEQRKQDVSYQVNVYVWYRK